MATRQQLQELAHLRLREAEALFDAGLYDGCAYLCGYAVEIALKARICATLDIDAYPDKVGRLTEAFRTHNFDHLKLLAGLERELSPGNPARYANWAITSEWTPERRYEPPGTYDRSQARKILDAIVAQPDGVLACISSRW